MWLIFQITVGVLLAMFTMMVIIVIAESKY